jgi:hypothetical protein
MTPRLIGGEMTLWSDLDGRHGAGPVRTATLRPLLVAASGRTLVAGPHHTDLLESLPFSQLTLLARGLPDADHLADRYADQPGVTVLCGSLEKLAAAPAYDTVIALDGLGRLRSAEDDAAGTSWSDDLARLVSVLAPGGRLLLGVENLFGLHRMLALPPAPTDADWGDAADEYDPTRPASPAQLRSALAALGLNVRASYATFPDPTAPSLLLSTDLLADRSVRGWATAAIRTAAAPPASAPAASVSASGSGSGSAPASALADPGRIAAGALRAGIGAELASGWVVVAQGGSGEPLPELPSAVVADGPRPTGRPAPSGASPASATDLVAAGPGVAGSGVAGSGVAGSGVAGAGVAEPGSAAADVTQGHGFVAISGVAQLPTGPTLDEPILAASLRRDMPALRELLAAWQSGPHAGVPADRIVVGPDGVHTPLIPAVEPATALARLAGTMIREGHAYLWPAPADQAELTALLAAMAGREAAEIPAVAGTATATDLRELVMERDRLARELAEARAKHRWYESMLLGREAELKRVRRINTMLMATMPGKAAKASYGGLRAAKRALRKLTG